MSGLAADNGQPPRRGAPPRAAIGLVADQATLDLLNDAAARRGIACAFALGGIDEALAGLHPDETADCVIIDLEPTPDAIDDIAVLVTGLPHYAELIVLGRFSEPQALELMQAGASLCLSKPLSESAINRIFGGLPARAPLRRPAPEPQPVAAPNPPAEPMQRIRRDDTLPAPFATPPAPAVEPAPPPSIRNDWRPEPEPAQPAWQPQPERAPPPIWQPPEEAPAALERPPALPPRQPERRYELAEPLPAARAAAAPVETLTQSPQTFNPAEPPPSFGQPPARTALAKGRVVSVVGCRGGVGASTIAVGLAWLLAEDMGRNTALLDLDPFFGSIALALNLDPGDALQQALERPSRVDAVFLDRAMRKVGQNLYVLCSEQSLDRSTRMDGNGATVLIRSLSGRYERVVVDLPRGEPETMTRALSLSDEILLVTDLSLAGARDAMRLMMLVRSATSYARVRIVGGGARDAGKSPILSPSEFRRAVGAPVEIAIPYDGETASDAARSGRAMPKVFPRSSASKALRNLAQSLESHEQPEQKRRLLWWKR